MADIIFGIFALYVLVSGIYQVITGKLPQAKQTDRLLTAYTYESVVKYTKVTGIIYIVLGIILALQTLESLKVINLHMPVYVYLVGLIAVIIGYFVASKSILKKIY